MSKAMARAESGFLCMANGNQKVWLSCNGLPAGEGPTTITIWTP